MSFAVSVFQRPWRLNSLSDTPSLQPLRLPLLLSCAEKICLHQSTKGDKASTISSLTRVYDIGLFTFLSTKPVLTLVKLLKMNALLSVGEIIANLRYNSNMSTGQVGKPDLAMITASP